MRRILDTAKVRLADGKVVSFPMGAIFKFLAQCVAAAHNLVREREGVQARLAQATALNPLNPSRLNDLGPPAAGGGGGG